MTKLQLSPDNMGPFAVGIPEGAADAATRIRMVREFSIEECEQALALPDLQPSVRKAVTRRLRALGGGIQGSGTG